MSAGSIIVIVIIIIDFVFFFLILLQIKFVKHDEWFSSRFIIIYRLSVLLSVTRYRFEYISSQRRLIKSKIAIQH